MDESDIISGYYYMYDCGIVYTCIKHLQKMHCSFLYISTMEFHAKVDENSLYIDKIYIHDSS